MEQETEEGIVVLVVAVVLTVLTSFLMPAETNIFLMAFVVMAEMLILLAIVFIILRAIVVARWIFNYNILKRGKTPENPIKLSVIYDADFFMVKEILANGVVKIVGIKLDLGFKECTENLYVRFSRNIISQLKPGEIYDFKMRPV